jgi:hypothetical protein
MKIKKDYIQNRMIIFRNLNQINIDIKYKILIDYFWI